MARRLRIQYENALYHVINRGNYRRDVFGSRGAVLAFQAALGEACERHGWRLHAYVVMRNHFHLALETPRPNLVEGMHWLQSAFATRFNRFRSERGHLFQGRYQALLVENSAALCRVMHYIHLNPVRAGIVSADQLREFASSSLPVFVRSQNRPAWLVSDVLLDELKLKDSPEGWSSYVSYLAALAVGSASGGKNDRHEEMSRGWAIGSRGWKRALAHEYSHLALRVGLPAAENRDLKEARWRETLRVALADSGRSKSEVDTDSCRASWIILIAARLRKEAAAPHGWITRELKMGNPATLRSALCRLSKLQHATA